jgi:hypothetical protein
MGKQKLKKDKAVASDALTSHLLHQDFSLVLGGPLFQLFRKAHLADNALLMAQRRVIFIVLLTWLPLLLLSALDGHVLGKTVTVPFLNDVEVHVRFLLAMPLLVAAELVVHQRMRPIVKMFVERNLIPDSTLPRFNKAITSAFRLRNSVWAEVLLIALVYIVGVTVVWRHYMALDTLTWYATPSAGGSTLSRAGIWYSYVSLPFFQFLLIRWYFRLFIWTRFLWQVSRIKLSLVPTHPDRLGGLSFLANSVYALTMLAFAHGVLLAGPLANRIFFLGATLPQYKVEIAAMTLFMLCLIIGPLLVFAPQLAEAKRKGLREYGTLAERYVRQFDTKWLRGSQTGDDELLGSGDIQSLADLGNSYEVVRGMRFVPVTKDTVLQVGIATLAPIVPLALTMMPLEELFKTLFGVLF